MTTNTEAEDKYGYNQAGYDKAEEVRKERAEREQKQETKTTTLKLYVDGLPVERFGLYVIHQTEETINYVYHNRMTTEFKDFEEVRLYEMTDNTQRYKITYYNKDDKLIEENYYPMSQYILNVKYLLVENSKRK
jgi:hypothetical protein